MDENERAKVERDTCAYVEKVQEEYTNILRDLRELSEELAVEIVQPRLDRSKISIIAGKIGKETYRHL